MHVYTHIYIFTATPQKNRQVNSTKPVNNRPFYLFGDMDVYTCNYVHAKQKHVWYTMYVHIYIYIM